MALCFARAREASLEEKKRTFGERGARAHHLLRHVPHFMRLTVACVSFSWSSFASRRRRKRGKGDAKLFPSLGFPTLGVRRNYSQRRDFSFVRELERCVRVCSRRTRSDRDLKLLFVRALYTARSTKVEVWTCA